MAPILGPQQARPLSRARRASSPHEPKEQTAGAPNTQPQYHSNQETLGGREVGFRVVDWAGNKFMFSPITGTRTQEFNEGGIIVIYPAGASPLHKGGCRCSDCTVLASNRVIPWPTGKGRPGLLLTDRERVVFFGELNKRRAGSVTRLPR
jgi:hypothetical protein